MLEERPADLLPLQAWCRCCGVKLAENASLKDWQGNPTWRCSKHIDRNPCAIEGCTRTTKASGQYATDQWLCGEHWKIGCPPRSAKRRIYHRYFARAKKYGWSESSRISFWAFWNRLVAQARKKCAGDIDETEINRMFGWE